MPVRGSYEKKDSSGPDTWKYLSLSLDLSQTLSQASCSDFVLKSKLMLKCFQELRPRALRKTWFFFLTVQGSEEKMKKTFLVPKINFYTCRFGASVLYPTISPEFFFFQNFKLLIVYDIFPLSLTWDYMREKISNDICSEKYATDSLPKINSYP